MPQKTRPKARGMSTTMNKDRFFSVSVKLTPTSESFTLKNIHNEMKIGELKSYAEFAMGIPKSMQRVRYLDQGDLLDTSDVRQNDIVPGAQLHMELWHMWGQLVEAVASNDTEWVFKLGVTPDSDFNTPNSEYMNPRTRKQWLAERAFVALYVAAHRGNTKMVEKLLAAGADVNQGTSSGRNALHVAAAQGHGHIVDTLLDSGADIDAEDSEGNNALAIANKFGNKGCERHLFLFRWQQRAKATKTQVNHEMFAHQYFDSSCPVWLKGDKAQLYFTQILPPGEFEGTALNAPKRSPRRSKSKMEDDEEDEGEEEGEEQYTPSGPDDERRDSATGVGGLSAIKEEQSRYVTSGRHSMGVPSSHSSSSKHNKADTEPVRTKSYGFAKKEKAAAKEKSSFASWLAKKEAEDAIRLAKQKDERSKKKQAEEEKKKAATLKAELEDKSYDHWLAEREAAARKATKQNKIHAATGGRSTQDIIRTVLERRENSGAAGAGAGGTGGGGGSVGIPSDLWKHVRDPTKYQEIQYRGLMLLENYKEQPQKT